MSATEQITIRLPTARVHALKAEAKAEHRSLAQQVEHMLAMHDAPPPMGGPAPEVYAVELTDELARDLHGIKEPLPSIVPNLAGQATAYRPKASWKGK